MADRIHESGWNRLDPQKIQEFASKIKAYFQNHTWGGLSQRLKCGAEKIEALATRAIKAQKDTSNNQTTEQQVVIAKSSLKQPAQSTDSKPKQRAALRDNKKAFKQAVLKNQNSVEKLDSETIKRNFQLHEELFKSKRMTEDDINDMVPRQLQYSESVLDNVTDLIIEVIESAIPKKASVTEITDDQITTLVPLALKALDYPKGSTTRKEIEEQIAQALGCKKSDASEEVNNKRKIRFNEEVDVQGDTIALAESNRQDSNEKAKEQKGLFRSEQSVQSNLAKKNISYKEKAPASNPATTLAKIFRDEFINDLQSTGRISKAAQDGMTEAERLVESILNSLLDSDEVETMPLDRAKAFVITAVKNELNKDRVENESLPRNDRNRTIFDQTFSDQVLKAVEKFTKSPEFSEMLTEQQGADKKTTTQAVTILFFQTTAPQKNSQKDFMQAFIDDEPFSDPVTGIVPQALLNASNDFDNAKKNISDFIDSLFVEKKISPADAVQIKQLIRNNNWTAAAYHLKIALASYK